jgi:hypothetical protein
MTDDYIFELQEYAVQLTERIEELEEEINERRKVVKNVGKEIKQVKISQRLVFLGIIDNDDNTRLVRTYTELKNGAFCDLHHPSYKTYHSILAKISARLSIAYDEQFQEQPHILNSDRTNIYSEEFFEDTGDVVIFQYIDEHPINTWNINWQWRFN